MDKLYKKAEDALHRAEDDPGLDLLQSKEDRKTVLELLEICGRIDCMEGAGGYAQAGDWEMEGRGSYGNSYGMNGQGMARSGRSGRHSGFSGETGMSGRLGRGRTTGRFVSRAEGPDGMMEHLQAMLEEAETPEERAAVQRFMRELG